MEEGMMHTRMNVRHKSRTRQSKAPRGFTLIEVLIAITILAGVVLTMAMNTTNSSRSVASSGTRSRAQALLDQQISRARIWPTYSTLNQLTNAKYNVSSNGLAPSTVISMDTTSGKNLTTVTVTVTGAASVLPSPMVRSIAIAAP
jgi:prepilin-type N-terminal cleavage/methylation domain-containing protein